MRRFLLHVLPTGIKRIRHYGLLALSKAEVLAQAREALKLPASNPLALESAQNFMQRVANIDLAQCPGCKEGRLRLVEVCKGCKTLPAPEVLGTQNQGEVNPKATGPP